MAKKKKAAPKAPRPKPKALPKPKNNPRPKKKKRAIAGGSTPKTTKRIASLKNNSPAKNATKRRKTLSKKAAGVTGSLTERRNKNSKKPKSKRKKKPGKTKRIRNAIAQRAYNKYLKKMYIPDDSVVSTYEMNNVVREKLKLDIRYDTDVPALFSTVLIAAQGVDGSQADDISIDRFVPGPFGARLVISNNGQKDVYLNKDGVAIFNVNGGTLIQNSHVAEVILPNKQYRAGESSLNIGGRWIQSRNEATTLGRWVLANQFDGGESYTIDIFGNTSFDPGDIIIVEYAEIGLDDTIRFMVTSVRHSYDNGLSTSLTVRRIYPDASEAFMHRQGIPHNPILL